MCITYDATARINAMTDQEKIESLEELIADGTEAIKDYEKTGSWIDIAETESLIKQAKAELKLLNS